MDINSINNFLSENKQYMDLFLAATFAAVIFINRKSITKISRLKSLDQLKNPDIKENTNKVIDYNRLNRKKFSDIINDFIIKIEESVPKDNLNCFYNNINNLKIFSKNDFFSIIRSLGGYYNVKTNSINIKCDYGHAINHELLHMASGVYQNKNLYSGFNHVIKTRPYNILFYGKGINEGSTELINNHFFPSYYPYSVYSYLTSVMEILEKFIGFDNFCECYFNSDIKKLVEYFKKYTTDEEIITFMNDMDDILLKNRTSRFINKTNYIEKRIRRISNFLYKYGLGYYNDLLENGSINEDEYNTLLNNYKSKLEVNLMIYNGFLYKHYDPCTPNESNHINYVVNNKNKVLIKKIYCEQ